MYLLFLFHLFSLLVLIAAQHLPFTDTFEVSMCLKFGVCLWSCWKIIQQHTGTVWLVSPSNKSFRTEWNSCMLVKVVQLATKTK